MRKTTVTFRLEEERTKALDQIARNLERDRTYILREAVSAYIDIHRWQLEHISEGLRQAEKRKFAPDAEVTAAFKKWRD